MDKLNVHPRCPRETWATQQQPKKKKEKQIKVVYISNPMRFQASASEFKGLVQQFTGRDADVAELSRLAGLDVSYHDEPSASADRVSFSTDDDSASDQRHRHQHQQPEAPYRCAAAAAPPPPLDELDEVLTPQVLENIFSFLPSSLYYEPPPPIM